MISSTPRAAPGPFAVIGAGPAGLLAAETLAARGGEVVVYDRMPSVGRKFLLAGRGGLNLTHSEALDLFLTRYGSGAERLRPYLDRFPPEALRAWAADLGQETMVGSSGRVFPVGWKASPLLRAWLRRLDGAGIRLALRHRWTGIGPDGALRFETPDGPVEVPPPAATILALGGASWPRLGSDGAWVPVLEGLGPRPNALRPANCSLLVPWTDHFAGRFAGEPLKRVAVTFAGERRLGEAVVSRAGVEGGVVYALSSPVRDALARGEEASLSIDLRPDRSVADLAAALARPRGRQSGSTFLRKAAHLAPVGIGLLHEATGTVLPTGPQSLAQLIKAVPVRVVGTGGLDRAISTAGGIRFEDLDERLMLRARPGLFAAGEMLDWEAPTGGYLLQACFATGVAAAEGAWAWSRGGAAG
ncbi:NAD(P)/FAD-dependent oxidoreductase [uncultured Enterovirga sp.]|uniref:NAD(P)/FAD-dependent oxidoreductase n=1 Tax=uncultured Enterovirga sp. TaxID=2026352 RepID=UPI0035CBC4FC